MTKDNLELEQKPVQNLDRNFAQLFHFNFGCVLVNADIPSTPFHSIVRAPLYDLKLFPDPHGLVNEGLYNYAHITITSSNAFTLGLA